jgi:Kef-type K+ transport system membrane component KefB
MIAALMNCRGVVGLIFLSVGSRNGLITQYTYTVLLGVALATTFITAPVVIRTMHRRSALARAADPCWRKRDVISTILMPQRHHPSLIACIGGSPR